MYKKYIKRILDILISLSAIILLWPVYVNYTPDDWDSGVLDEYAAQAALAAKDVLMINPLDRDPANHGGAFHFHDGQIAARHPFDEEGILIVNI